MMKKLLIILLITQSFVFASSELAENFYKQSLLAYKSWDKTKNPKTFHKALFTIQSAIDIEPTTSEYWFFKGFLYMQVPSKTTLANAQSALMQAYILDKKNTKAQILLAHNLFMQGKFVSAFNQYFHIVKQKKEYHTVDIIHPMLLSLISVGAKERAKNIINEFVKLNPHNTALRTTQAIIYKMIGDKKLAKEILEHIRLSSSYERDKLKDYADFLEKKWQKEERK